MVRAPDLKSEDTEFKSRPDHQLDLFQVAPGSTPRLRLLSLFQWFVSLALKSPNGERSIKYIYIHVQGLTFFLLILQIHLTNYTSRSLIGQNFF